MGSGIWPSPSRRRHIAQLHAAARCQPCREGSQHDKARHSRNGRDSARHHAEPCARPSSRRATTRLPLHPRGDAGHTRSAGSGVSICGHWRTAARAVPKGMACVQPTYRPRDAEHTVLHQVIREHLESFLRAAAEAGDGVGLPAFVEREFREFLTCGAFDGGFARFRCESCAHEHLVPYSCKGRGFCPSCGGRRMTERAAHLVDEVLPRVPVRQWVLTVPYRLRYRMAFDHGLSRAVGGSDTSGGGLAVHGCAQIVPISSPLGPILAYSCVRRRDHFALTRPGFTRTSAIPGPGLKILVSAVQSRPCPPFLPGSYAPADSCRDRERAHFLPWRAHVSAFRSTRSLGSPEGRAARTRRGRRPLFRQIRQVAPLDAPVLIQGESGTGKELVAAAVLWLSGPARSPPPRS